MMPKRLMLYGLMSLILLAGSVKISAEDEKAAPEGILVSPPESAFSIKIKTDRQVYSPKEALKIQLELSRDAYVYVYDINPEGQATLLFPNGFSWDNFLKAGRHTLPDRPTYSWVVTEPLGVELLQAIALLKPLALPELVAQDENPFPQLSDDPKALRAQIQKLIEITVEPDEWAADWTQFLIAPAVAHLKIISEPQGAQVYVNGELRGVSPLELEVAPGRVRIEIIKSGYQRWSKTVTLANRARSELSVLLEPARPSLFPSSPPTGGEEVGLSALALGLNAGLNAAGLFSAGLELGFPAGLSLGGSISFTQDDVPPYYDIGRQERFPSERIYNQGPETEAYVKLSLPAMGAFYLQLGGGIAVQERVHIAAPGGVIIISALAPLVEILPNGYRETVSYLTAFAGVAVPVGSNLLSVSFHNRRGWVLGFSVQF